MGALNFIFLFLFLIPIAALGWRIVVTKTHSQWIRGGAAAAAMISLVGSFVVFGDLTEFKVREWRDDVALLAAMMASIYLVAWSLRRRSNRRHRTISIFAAVIGFVPVAGAILGALAARME